MCYLRVSYVLLTVKISYFFILFEKIPENEEKPRKYWIFPGLSVFFFSLCNYLAEVEEGNKAAQRASDSIESVVDGIKSIAEASQELSQIAQEQATAMEQAEQGINQISEVVQSNSATAEETSATSQELSAQATSLNDLISRFVLS